jgi:hypothetical protein
VLTSPAAGRDARYSNDPLSRGSQSLSKSTRNLKSWHHSERLNETGRGLAATAWKSRFNLNINAM